MMEVFFNPLPIEEPNILRITSKDKLSNVEIKFDDQVAAYMSGFDISKYCTQKIVKFSVTSSDLKIIDQYILHQVDANKNNISNAFNFIHNETKTGKYNKQITKLIIEHYIYHQKNIQSVSSSDKLRDDELECLSLKLAEENGHIWLFNFCKRFDEDNTSKNASINWLWGSNRLIHFVDGKQAQKILENKIIPAGSFIIRPSFTSPGHIAITLKKEKKISQNIFQDPTLVRYCIWDSPELKYGINAYIPEDGDVKWHPKNEFLNEKMFTLNSILNPPNAKCNYVRCNKDIYNQKREKDTAHPEFCRVFGPGLTDAYTKKVNIFTIQTANCYGENIKFGGCKFNIETLLNIKSFCDNDNGTYTVSYEANKEGQYQLLIKLIGQDAVTILPDNHPGWSNPIKDSPITIEVFTDKMEIDVYTKDEYKKLMENQENTYKVHHTSTDAFDYDNYATKIMGNVRCVMSIWMAKDINPKEKDEFKLATNEFGPLNQLHPDEDFYWQLAGAKGTAFLVTDKIICTSGYSVNRFRLDQIKFVSGFMVGEDEITRTNIVADNIYTGVKIIYQKEDDFTLIELDRSVKNATLSISQRNTRIKPKTSVYVIGHPCGLPLKVSHHKDSIVTISNETTFKARLDAFCGSIGSPVFNMETHQLEGIVMKGCPDTILVKDYYRSLIIPKESSENGPTCYDIRTVRDILTNISKYK